MKPINFPDVRRLVVSFGKNSVWQYYEKEFSITDYQLFSEDPFILSTEYGDCLLTNDENVKNDDRNPYVILTYKKPTIKNFKDGRIFFKRWIKHPKFDFLSPDETVHTWKNGFHFINEDEDNDIKGLRPPQKEALHHILASLENRDENIRIVVMPTGTGKTETMLAALIQGQCKKLLVTVPSDALRTQISEKFITLGLLKKFKIVDECCGNPIVGIINSKFENMENLKAFILSTNVIVATMDILASFPEQEKKLLSLNCSHFFVDEAHHAEARTWKEVIDKFNKNKVYLFTATPFRNDGQTLPGNIISRFKLKDAQDQKYYKQIDFMPIREYNPKLADKKIAEKAVAQLKKDIKHGYDHIIMARCKDKKRAEEVFLYYNKYAEFNPIVIYTGIKKLDEKIKSIKEGKHRVIVCVNMLGEGFDLPQLKIAAIHDERQSLPIALQFIGRFTRTSYNTLGNASFITNIANPPIHKELEDLYAKDADWNLLLPGLNDNATQKEIDLRVLLSSFENLNNSMIPFQNIRPALSTIIYRNSLNNWNIEKWEEGIEGIENYEYKFTTSNDNTLIIILGKFNNVDWGNFDTVRNLEWHLIVVYWDLRPGINRIFVNTSMDGLKSEKLLKVIFNENISIIQGPNVFRIFYNIKRLSLYNIGARKVIGQDITFQSYYGKSVQDGIKEIEERRLFKNNFFGIGYRNGEKVSLGCSVKGKIWSYRRENLNELIKWCNDVGDIVENDMIDPDVVLKNTLSKQKISKRPAAIPIAIDWDPERYISADTGYFVTINDVDYDLSEFDLSIIERKLDESIQFSLNSETHKIIFDFELGENIIDGQPDYYFKITKLTDLEVKIKHGKNNNNIEEYFQDNTPIIWFADSSYLYQNYYVVLREEIDNIPMDKILVDDWNGINIEKESQDIFPYIQDSIQYYFIEKIKGSFDIIYDDDGSGEIADIISINNFDNKIDIHLFHLKFAIDGCVSNRIDNFYEVCGQAQKSIKWKYRKVRMFFDHLFRRKIKKLGENTCNRIIKGTEEQLEEIFDEARLDKEIFFHIYIVQPGLSKENASNDILHLLGVTYHYLYTTSNIELVIYCSK